MPRQSPRIISRAGQFTHAQLRCGCTTLGTRGAGTVVRDRHCSFHGPVLAEWKSRHSKAADGVFEFVGGYIFGLLPMVLVFAAIPGFAVGLIVSESAGWAVAAAVALFVLYAAWPSREEHPIYTPFTGKVEPGDISPDDCDLVDGRYLLRRMPSHTFGGQILPVADSGDQRK